MVRDEEASIDARREEAYQEIKRRMSSLDEPNQLRTRCFGNAGSRSEAKTAEFEGLLIPEGHEKSLRGPNNACQVGVRGRFRSFSRLHPVLGPIHEIHSRVRVHVAR